MTNVNFFFFIYAQVLCTELQSNMDNHSVNLNLSDDISNVHDRQENCDVERTENQEKKTRFSLSHDEGIEVLDLLKLKQYIYM